MKRSYNISRKDIKQLMSDIITYAPELSYDLEILQAINDKLKNNFNLEEYGDDYLGQLKQQVDTLPVFKTSYQHTKLFCLRGLYIDGSKYKTNYKKISLSERNTVRLSEEFFHECGPFFSVPFKDFKSEAENHLKFISPSRQSEGEIAFVPSSGDYFIFVPRYNNISRVSILIHEIEHYIDICNRYEFHKQHLIRESSSIFMELIGCDWLAKKLNLSKDGIKRKFQIHSNVKNDSYDIFFKTQALHIIKNNFHLNDDDLLNKLDECGFNEYNLAIFARDPLERDYYYQISYLIAIELYNLYQNDKEKALYILKQIIIYGTDENIFDLLNRFNIVLNKNVHNIERNMCLSLVRKKED